MTTRTQSEQQTSGGGHTETAEESSVRSTRDTDGNSDSDGDPLVTANEVDFAYGAVSVLEGVSVAIRPARITALIGPNGVGKTTLLQALAGLTDPSGGSITYHGPDTVRHIGYLPQNPAFRPGFSALETLEFYASLVGETDPHARLERVGLEAAADRRVEALSGGMTQLLGIAQATIGDPPLVALDEPASGLDPGMTTHVFDVAADLAATGTAVLLTSHDLDLVERTADEVILLDDGGVADQGSPSALLDRYEADSLWETYEAALTGDLHTVRVRGDSS